MRTICGQGCATKLDDFENAKYASGATASAAIVTLTFALLAMKNTKVGAAPNIGAVSQVSLAENYVRQDYTN